MDGTNAQAQTTRVLLHCDPPLLREILSMLLSQLAGIELVQDAEGAVDVVVASAPGATSTWPADLPGVATGVRFVALDTATNMLRVRTGRDHTAADELRPGTLAGLVDAVRCVAIGHRSEQAHSPGVNGFTVPAAGGA